jgi:hypothetical protein
VGCGRGGGGCRFGARRLARVLVTGVATTDANVAGAGVLSRDSVFESVWVPASQTEGVGGMGAGPGYGVGMRL